MSATKRVIPLEEAVRRLTSLPARNLRLQRRGLLERGHFADVVVFDPDRIQDHATYDEPHQYATGVLHVAVNGELVLRDGEHTGALPGRVVRGPLWSGDASSGLAASADASASKFVISVSRPNASAASTFGRIEPSASVGSSFLGFRGGERPHLLLRRPPKLR